MSDTDKPWNRRQPWSTQSAGDGTAGQVLTLRTGSSGTPTPARAEWADVPPGTLAGLTDVDADSPADGDTLVYDEASETWQPGAPSGGGGAAEGVGDYMTFYRTGAIVGGGQTFDFTADGVASSGTTVALDESSEWVEDNYGWAAPQVTIDGLYTVVVRSRATGSTARVVLKFFDSTGAPFRPWKEASNFGALGDLLTNESADGASVYVTAFLPAGTHIDITTVDPSDPDAIALVIQHAG